MKPILQISFEIDSDFSLQREVNGIATYIAEFYQRNLPKCNYGNIKKILFIISESTENRVWESTKEDPILTLYYNAELKDINTQDVSFFNSLFIESAEFHSSELPVENSYFLESSDKFSSLGYNYSLRIEKKKSPNGKKCGIITVEMSPTKAEYYCELIDEHNNVLEKIKFAETNPFQFAITGLVEKISWIDQNQILVTSRIYLKFKVSFEKGESIIEYETDERKRKISEIELKLLSPNTSYEEILKLQEEKMSLLF